MPWKAEEGILVFFDAEDLLLVVGLVLVFDLVVVVVVVEVLDVALVGCQTSVVRDMTIKHIGPRGEPVS